MPVSCSGSVAHPLYRTFLSQAEAAHKRGEEERALELFGLALDSAPEEVRPMVVVAAGPYLAATSGARHGAARTAGPFDVPMPRIPVEPPAVEQVAPPLSAPLLAAPAPALAPALPRATSPARKQSSAAQAIFAFLLLGASLYGFATIALPMLGVQVPLPALAVSGVALPGGGAEGVDAAARRLDDGDPHAALAALPVSAPAGREGEAARIRARALALVGSEEEAADAWGLAAAHDPGSGRIALEAGDWLAERGHLRRAADAYLYAVVPDRTADEVERIARMQERAGYPERAERVRRGI